MRRSPLAAQDNQGGPADGQTAFIGLVLGASTPNLRRMLAAMQARPAYARAIARGGPIMID